MNDKRIAIVSHKTEREDVDRIIKEMKDYFGEKVPFKMVFDVFDANEGVVILKEFKVNSEGKRLFGTENGKQITKTVINQLEYQQVIFVYNIQETGFERDDTKNVTAWAFHNELYFGTEYCEVPVGKGISNTWEKHASTHETMHCDTNRVNRTLVEDIPDYMDVAIVNGVEIPYLKNDDPDATDGNYAMQLLFLQPHWNLVVDWSRAEEFIEAQRKLEEAVAEKEKLEEENIKGKMDVVTHIGYHHGADAKPLKLIEMKVIYQETHYKNLYKGEGQPRSRFKPLTEQEKTDAWNYLKQDTMDGRKRYEAILESGWRDIAYHTLIATDGWEHIRDKDLMGYHISNLEMNRKSFGMCINGNRSKLEIDETTDRYVREATEDLKKDFPTLIAGVPHNKFADKECPGSNITQVVIDDWFNGKSVVEEPKELTLTGGISAMIQVFKEYDDVDFLKIPFRDAVNKEIDRLSRLKGLY